MYLLNFRKYIKFSPKSNFKIFSKNPPQKPDKARLNKMPR